MAELAEHALLSRSGMTRLIDRLEREGLVARDLRQGRPRLLRGADRAGRRAVDQARATYLAVVRAGFLRHFSATS